VSEPGEAAPGESGDSGEAGVSGETGASGEAAPVAPAPVALGRKGAGGARRALLGVVLAGGASRRYGRAKWRVEVAGVSMAKRAADALSPLVAFVGVVGDDPEVARTLGLPGREDPRPGSGPLGGLHTALTWAAREELAGALVLGCDLPLVTTDVLRVLVERWGGQLAVVPRGKNGLEPVCALFSVAALGAVAEAMLGSDASLHGLLAGLDPDAVPVEELARVAATPEVLLNVNTPADRMRAEALLHVGPPLLCVVGKKNSGKTGVTVALAAELGQRGRRVMTVKHGHGFELDRPGTDSWRHRREGGAERVLVVGPEDLAMLGGWGPEGERPLRELADRWLADAEIVVAEGWKAGPDPKVEVFRVAAHAEPILVSGSADAETFLAVVTDDPGHEPGVPVFSLSDPAYAARVADLVERVLLV